MTTLSSPLPLSTPDAVFEDPTPPVPNTLPPHTDDELSTIYEIARTAQEIHNGEWKTIALQFPDEMLRDAPRVYEALEDALRAKDTRREKEERAGGNTGENGNGAGNGAGNGMGKEREYRLCILADTSYGACCVDEIAAEHCNAQVVVHYGRSCLSPTARLPVIYVFTTRPLALEDVVFAFESTYGAKDAAVILMADVVYHSHIAPLKIELKERGYTNLVAPDVVHDPSAVIPNRGVGLEVDVGTCSLFHISDPPQSLLLMLSSRVRDMHIYPTTPSPTNTNTKPEAILANTTLALRRRYGLLTRLSTCAVYGILINTLSVANYISSVASIKSQIAAAGKKSYTFVVGKVNAAKIANFAEIEGWVVVGCWEGGLIESGEFYKPLITPFELGFTLMGDDKRVWTGVWRGGMELSEQGDEKEGSKVIEQGEGNGELEGDGSRNEEDDEDDEEESEPPEFDLRTGRYISHTRPMRTRKVPVSSSTLTGSKHPPVDALVKRAKGDLATVNGAVSPGAEFLRSQRTWTGLGSDFATQEAATVEEGRRGVAGGYAVGEGERS